MRVATETGLATRVRPTLPSAERLLASAVAFLVEGGEEEAAGVLLACSLGLRAAGGAWYDGDELHAGVHVELTGPRAAYELLCDDHHPISRAILAALSAVLPPGLEMDRFSVRAELVAPDPGWRTRLLERARGEGVDNQAVGFAPARVWQGLRFRSESELRIAQALDRAGVLYLPNCKARLGAAGARQNREADFLVCFEGRWGILEVDGEPFHPPSRTAQDHERDRLFRTHGILVVEHFDARECYGDAGGVVKRFLEILARA